MFVSPHDFGTVHKDGIADDATVLNAFFAGFPGNGVGFLPAGVYAIASTVRIGDGSISQRSTKNGFTLICEGGLAHECAMFDPGSGIPRSGVIFKWIGAPGGSCVEFAGPVHGVRIVGALQALGEGIAAFGIRAWSLSNSEIDGLAAYDCTVKNVELNARPTVSIEGNGNGLGTAGNRIGAVFSFAANYPGAIALSLNGHRVAGGPDTTHNEIGLLKVGFNIDGGVGLHLGFCDFNRIRNMVGIGYGEVALNNAAGIWADGGAVPFKAPDLNFIDQAAVGHQVGLRSTGAVGENFIQHYSVNDGSLMPIGAGFSGYVRSHDPLKDGLTFGKYSRPKISVVGSGDGLYLMASDGSVHIGSITRQINDLNVAGWGQVKAQPAAVAGPNGSGHAI